MSTIESQILIHLDAHGRSTVSEIANAIGFSLGYTRQRAKELHEDGKVEGEKVPVTVPAAVINGKMHVMSDSKEELLDIVRLHAPHYFEEAKKMSVQQLQNLIESHVADETTAFDSERWEFWPA